MPKKKISSISAMIELHQTAGKKHDFPTDVIELPSDKKEREKVLTYFFSMLEFRDYSSWRSNEILKVASLALMKLAVDKSMQAVIKEGGIIERETASGAMTTLQSPHIAIISTLNSSITAQEGKLGLKMEQISKRNAQSRATIEQNVRDSHKNLDKNLLSLLA